MLRRCKPPSPSSSVLECERDQTARPGIDKILGDAIPVKGWQQRRPWQRPPGRGGLGLFEFGVLNAEIVAHNLACWPVLAYLAVI